MKLLQLALFASIMVLLSACSTTQYDDPKPKKGYLGKCRITYYNKHEDKFGSQVSSPYVKRAQIGVTVAAHKDFPFNTKIDIPDLKSVYPGPFRVDDRGTAVTKKKASHGQTYVWDVYVGDPRTMRKMEKTMPEYMDVYAVE